MRWRKWPVTIWKSAWMHSARMTKWNACSPISRTARASPEMSKLELQPLERLDLRKSTTVGQIVLAMNQCSFGARMLGEVAVKLRDWIQQGRKIRVVYDGRPLRDLFENMRSRGWIHDIVRSDALQSLDAAGFEHLVVGRYSESADEFIHRLDGSILINKEELSRPGQVRDGFFPD